MIQYEQKSSPTHFSDDNKGPFKNPFSPEAALLQQEIDDISSIPRQVRPLKAHECCAWISNCKRHFRQPSFIHQGGGSKDPQCPRLGGALPWRHGRGEGREEN
jgi:hypothetical protein